MDASSAPVGQLDFSKLSPADKQELQQFVVNESQKSRIQHAVHGLTDICWTKCVTGKITSGKLERGEESCTQNCVDRYMDANMTVLKHLESLRSQGM
ncbi:MAG: import inner membrane translocase subunit TIM8 [Lasallia pustulata]|uniref:Mitochondrial import inner membrane translocase subunit n=1 Tax=Lasallia pustulata TaxID=136370 RepID=A0A1W5CXY3_9LECA|nr:MAG: import inner membrane translocase subunit TIM8 [Lasallia pustulata]SLM35718.1 mitochondrial intermembrane space translocase subunit [Lasallia pustulata]